MTRFYNTDSDFSTSFGPFEGDTFEEAIQSEEVHNLIISRVLEISEENYAEGLPKNDRKKFLDRTKAGIIDSLNDSFIELDEKVEALVIALDISPDEILDITETKLDDCLFKVGNREYLVCTDDEADEKWDEALDSYIEECVLSEIPQQLRYYFDEEAWKNDAKINDCRAHSLSSYDGEELEEKIDKEWYFIYRVN